MTELPHLLVIHGNMAPLGGAERDLLVALPAHLRRWSVSLATLNAPQLVHDRCRDLGVDLVTPESPWDQPVGGLDEVTAAAGRSARRAWRSLRTSAMGTTLDVAIERADAALIVIGPGTLEILEHLPPDLPLHAFLVEMHRGVHDDVLHRRFDGTPKRPMWFTKVALSYLRRWDRWWHRRLWNRPMTAISSNTPTSIRRLAAAHRWPVLEHWIAGEHGPRDASLRPSGVGVLWHAVDPSQWPEFATDEERLAWDEFKQRPEGAYLLTIGRACYMKGSLEALRIARASGLQLVHVGGGETDALKQHADGMGVALNVMPRITDLEIAGLMRHARAVLAIARGEGFGLTPLEAMMVGTPALAVDEAGFTHTITDGWNGRRLPWPVDDEDMSRWVEAIVACEDPELRTRWAKAGRSRIEERWTPEHHAEAVARSLAAMGASVSTTDAPFLPGLDPA